MRFPLRRKLGGTFSYWFCSAYFQRIWHNSEEQCLNLFQEKKSLWCLLAGFWHIVVNQPDMIMKGCQLLSRILYQEAPLWDLFYALVRDSTPYLHALTTRVLCTVHLSSCLMQAGAIFELIVHCSWVRWALTLWRKFSFKTPESCKAAPARFSCDDFASIVARLQLKASTRFWKLRSSEVEGPFR